MNFFGTFSSGLHFYFLIWHYYHVRRQSNLTPHTNVFLNTQHKQIIQMLKLVLLFCHIISIYNSNSHIFIYPWSKNILGWIYLFEGMSFHICILAVRVLSDASKVSDSVFGQKNKYFWAIMTFWTRKLQVNENYK